MDVDNLLLKKLSTSFCFALIGFLAFVVGAYTLSCAQNLKKIENAPSFYIAKSLQ